LRPFKFDLNLAVLPPFENWSVIMDIPASLTPSERPLVGMEEWLDVLGHFSLLSCFDWLIVVCSASFCMTD